MRPALFFAIQAAKRYRKKHGLPDYMEITEEDIQKKYDENLSRDYDCTTVDEKYRKGLNLERVDLPNCSSWLVRYPGNPEGKIIYYIHGGGFVNGSTRQGMRFISYAVKHFGYDIYSVDYRMAPNYKCLDTVSDCEEGYRFLL